ncbi:MAG: RIP metalloprotease RseP [candidate division WOR-3 bacterium]|nr:RIP metalloprotease RseP [candidate division WOR-3 bacterium]
MISSIIWVVIFISILIIIHEFGHLVVAKLAHIPVEVFSMGFGPIILKKKLGETEYRLSLVPLGGFIKMTGEEEHAGPAPTDAPVAATGYNDKPLGVRVAVIAAGPVSNLILAFLMLVVMYLAFGIKYVQPVIAPLPNTAAERIGLQSGDLLVAAAGETIPNYGRFEDIMDKHIGAVIPIAVRRGSERLLFDYTVPKDTVDLEPLVAAVVDRVRKESPAAKSGLRPGDTIVSVNGMALTHWDDFVDQVSQKGGQRIGIEWRRNGRLFQDSITPSVERDQMTEQRFGQVGVWVRLPKKTLPVQVAVWEAVKRTGFVVEQTVIVLYKVVTRQISTKAIGGPIMVAKIAYEGANWGAEYFIALWALLSVNLFVVNMLPIPVLDGGRILLDCIGGIRGRKLTEKEQNWAAGIGWAMIGALVLFTIFNDVLRLIRK